MKKKQTFVEKTANVFSKTPRIVKTSAPKKSIHKFSKSFVSHDHSFQSPSSTPQRTVKRNGPFDQVMALETSFNRLTRKSSQNREQTQTNPHNKQLVGCNIASDRTRHLQQMKQFVNESNRVLFQQMKKENKKLKVKLKQELVEQFQAMKREVIEYVNRQLHSQKQEKGLQDSEDAILSKFKTFENQINFDLPPVKQLQLDDSSRLDQKILELSDRIEECVTMVKVDFFCSFSQKLSEIIQKYNANFNSVQDNIDSVSSMVKQVIITMKDIVAKSKKLDAGQSPLNRTAKFTSIDH